MTEAGLSCSCIRCREYGHRLRDGWPIGEPRLARLDYQASGGREVLLSYEDENGTLFGLLRLRITANTAMIRELHVYGPEVALGARLEPAAQHRGLGEKLLRQAEAIAHHDFHARQVTVLSGIGAREYYRSLGYSLHGAYMVKELAPARPEALAGRSASVHT